MQSVTTLPCVNLNQAIHDIHSMLTTDPRKRNKRLARYAFVCRLANMSPVIENLAPEVAGSDPTFDELVDYFKNNQHASPTSDVMILSGGISPKDNQIWGGISAELTKHVNADLSLYMGACHFIVILLNRMKAKFCSLFRNKDIIFMMKGGVALRLALQHLYPREIEGVHFAFGLGGDNDTTFLINPKLQAFDIVHEMVCKFVTDFLIEMQGYMGLYVESMIGGTSGNVIEVNGTPLVVERSSRNNLRICKLDDENNVLEPLKTSEPSFLFVTRNSSLEFMKNDTELASFELIRWKLAYLVRLGDDVVPSAAEVLDVSVPKRNDTRLNDEFNDYKSGKYTTEIPFPELSCMHEIFRDAYNLHV